MGQYSTICLKCQTPLIPSHEEEDQVGNHNYWRGGTDYTALISEFSAREGAGHVAQL